MTVIVLPGIFISNNFVWISGLAKVYALPGAILVVLL